MGIIYNMNSIRIQSPRTRHPTKLITIKPKRKESERKNTADFLTNLSDIEKLRSSPDYEYLHRYSQHNRSLNSSRIMSTEELPEISRIRTTNTLEVPNATNTFDSPRPNRSPNTRPVPEQFDSPGA